MGDGAPRGPRRTCVGCRRTAHPDELIRVVRTPDGGLDVGRDQPGRGAWLCPAAACLAEAGRRRAFARALRGQVRPEAVAGLGVVIGG
ncbi:MAG: YlxR family protein [Iamia sp.]